MTESWEGFLGRWDYPSTGPFATGALGLLDEEWERLFRLLEGASEFEWDLVTNCAPWKVRTIAAHLATSTGMQGRAIDLGLQGTVEMAMPYEAQRRSWEELEPRPIPDILAALVRAANDFRQQINALSESELARLARHRAGPRPIWWFTAQRLVEVAFHRWDIAQSLGSETALSAPVASFVLPMLVEINLPPVYLRGPGGQARFRLEAIGEQRLAWTLAAEPGRLEVLAPEAASDVRISAEPSDLALLVYGRDHAALLRDGRLQVEGRPELLERVMSILAGP